MTTSILIFIFVQIIIFTNANVNVDDILDHRPRRNSRRLAMLWTIERSPGFYFDFALSSFVGSGADMVDIHILTSSLDWIYPKDNIDNVILVNNSYFQNNNFPNNNSNNNNNNNNFPNNNKRKVIYYHLIKWDDWIQRIKTHLGITIQPCIEYDCDYRKLADFKPMMGLLFQDLIPSDKYSFWACSDYDGFFGSFNQLLDFKKLYHYDIISGISKPVPDNLKLLRGNNAEIKKIEPTRVTGALMIHRNHPKINRLFFRSQDWKIVVSNMKKYYGFDDTNIIYDLKENYASVLATSYDIRQCCYSNRTKTVWKSIDSYNQFSNKYEQGALISNMPLIIIEMYEKYTSNPDINVKLVWKRALGLEISIVVNGNIQDRDINLILDKSPYIEYARPLFFHFLQWKYCCGNELKSSLESFYKDVMRQGLTFYTINCVQLSVKYLKKFEFSMC